MAIDNKQIFIVREMEVAVRKQIRVIAAENDCKMSEAIKIAVAAYFQLKEVNRK